MGGGISYPKSNFFSIPKTSTSKSNSIFVLNAYLKTLTVSKELLEIQFQKSFYSHTQILPCRKSTVQE